jgi:2-polyprenyl-6-methoxyphenol hydroxylase-like FAD-dependent oxidoreductase
VTRRGDHAVVLGASLAGLVHAVPLAERFDRVTLVERDVLPDGPEQRRGVPQGSHAHLLVPGGVTRLEELLPGMLADVSARGGHIIEAPEWRFHMGGDRLALTDTGLRITGATRPLIESVVRDRVLALDSVELLDGWTARELTTSADRTRVTGTRLRSETDPEQERVLNADLVVDTTGRGSPSPRWLEELGYAPPEEERLKVGVHYTTRLFQRDPADLNGCRHVLVDVPPDGCRGGVALAVEGGRWLVTLIGMLGERPPTELRGFTDYAASLWTDDLHEIVDGALPLGDASPRAFPAFSWQRYDRLRRLPERYAVSGDAVCSFDPRFGQGMTVAIIEAMELGRVLDRHGLDRVGERLLAAARPAVKDAWELATGSDLAHPEVDGPRPLPWRVTNAYMQRLLPVTHEDPAVAAALIRVVGMLDRPPQLMHPRMLWRVLGGGRRQTRPAVPAARVGSGA